MLSAKPKAEVVNIWICWRVIQLCPDLWFLSFSMRTHDGGFGWNSDLFATSSVLPTQYLWTGVQKSAFVASSQVILLLVCCRWWMSGHDNNCITMETWNVTMCVYFKILLSRHTVFVASIPEQYWECYHCSGFLGTPEMKIESSPQKLSAQRVHEGKACRGERKCCALWTRAGTVRRGREDAAWAWPLSKQMRGLCTTRYNRASSALTTKDVKWWSVFYKEWKCEIEWRLGE